LKAIHSAARLPVIVGTGHGALTNEDVAKHGARIMLQGHLPIAAAVNALHHTYSHLFSGGAAADLTSTMLSEREMARLVYGER
jgi:2-methylisocitrate lyase-like PEP mutase family enzyme